MVGGVHGGSKSSVCLADATFERDDLPFKWAEQWGVMERDIGTPGIAPVTVKLGCRSRINHRADAQARCNPDRNTGLVRAKTQFLARTPESDAVSEEKA